MDRQGLLTLTDAGLYCPAGDFYVDPWLPVERAVITHAHADHAHRDCRHYLTSREGERVLRRRFPADANIRAVAYGEMLRHNGVTVSLHPAGHIRGSAQVRLEQHGETWAVSGDYKLQPDPTCTAFEPIRCHTFVSESTFGLPIYRWPEPDQVFAEINGWWNANRSAGKTTVLYAYALGKAQRLLAGIDTSCGPIFTHGAVERMNEAYREDGARLPSTIHVAAADRKTDWSASLVLAPPSAHGTPWLRRFGAISTGFASGWMRIRGTRRRRAIDRGFVLSDHADWPALLETIRATQAERIWVTHGYTAALVRWFNEHGRCAEVVPTRFEGEIDDTTDNPRANE
jgi:putative mRNA 3-end processing factor